MSIYVFQPAATHTRTGYGELFDTLSLELIKKFPQEFSFSLTPGKTPDMELFFGQPYDDPDRHNFQKRRSCVRGVYTMFERPEIPGKFIRGVERSFEFVIVPTKWCFDLFTRIFPRHKIYLSRTACVDQHRYPYYAKPIDSSPFTVLWQGFHFVDRKGRERVQKAIDSLVLDRNIRVVFKMQALASHSKACFDVIDKHERWISDDCYHAQKLDLWRQCDFGVMPSKSEGIGMIPLEWMSSGLPCAFSDNTGASDYVDPSYNMGLVCDEEVIDPDGLKFYVPSIDTIREAIIFACDNRHEIRIMASRARYHMQVYNSPTVAAINLSDTLQQVRKDFGI